MKAIKYPKVDAIPEGAVTVSNYAKSVGQKNPAYICVAYDRYLAGKGKNPGYSIVNWQGFNWVIPN